MYIWRVCCIWLGVLAIPHFWVSTLRSCIQQPHAACRTAALPAPQTAIFVVDAEDVYNLLLLATRLTASRLRLHATCNILIACSAYAHTNLFECMHDSYPTAILSRHQHPQHAPHNGFVVSAFCWCCLYICNSSSYYCYIHTKFAFVVVIAYVFAAVAAAVRLPL